MTDLPERLLNGYRSFMTNHFSQQAARYRQLAEEGQRPEILMIACCDSRAAPETIFDASPGEIFVVRNVANFVPPFSPGDQYDATAAAIEFAVQSLKVKHVVILGHGRCGGINIVLGEVYKPLSSNNCMGLWMDLLVSVGKGACCRESMTETERQAALEHFSIRYSLKNLETFPWLKERKDQGLLTVHGAWFDISNGELWSLEQETGRFMRVEEKLLTRS
ncbi:MULTISPECIES: carbonic anhydrase [Bartonella]|uniref:Carbonic anhydrase n=1 Tax=Bartonella chomelii TaxID=236402 RepID=A0ABR6E3J5_9HYPH|nr:MULTISPECIES: carbonic anhydrase [Bartonella]MBA9082833.1 carbonic anhydrase [Bartonella chomelii]